MRSITTIILSCFLLFSLVLISCNTADNVSKSLFVVALEKETPDEPSSNWNPTLYRIDLTRGRIAQKSTLDTSGTPLTIQPQENGDLKVVIGYGLADNGSKVGEPYVQVFYVFPTTLAITQSVGRIAGVDDMWFLPPKEEVLAYAYKKEKNLKNTPLVISTPDHKIYTLNTTDKDFLWIEVLSEEDLEHPVSKIKIPQNKSILGNFTLPRNVALVNNNILACLFSGNVQLGSYHPGYVALINLKEQTVRLIEIGSNAGQGIVAE